MKNLFTTLTILSLTLLLAGCSKTPFKEQEPLQNAALVYVYVLMDDGVNDTERNPYYKVGFNGQNVKEGILEISVEYEGDQSYYNKSYNQKLSSLSDGLLGLHPPPSGEYPSKIFIKVVIEAQKKIQKAAVDFNKLNW